MATKVGPSLTRLTTEIPKHKLSVMIPSILSMRVKDTFLKIGHVIGINKPLALTDEQLAIPDTELAVQVTELVKTINDTNVFNHNVRTYQFGIGVAIFLNQLKDIDKEQMYIASMLHDVSLNKDIYNKNPTEDFEIISAQWAYDYLVNTLNYPKDKAHVIHEGIAWHTALTADGICDQVGPSINFVHRGAGIDIGGMWMSHVSDETLKNILKEYPRGDFVTEMIAFLENEAIQKPDCGVAFSMNNGPGLAKLMRDNPLDRLL